MSNFAHQIDTPAIIEKLYPTINLFLKLNNETLDIITLKQLIPIIDILKKELDTYYNDIIYLLKIIRIKVIGVDKHVKQEVLDVILHIGLIIEKSDVIDMIYPIVQYLVHLDSSDEDKHYGFTLMYSLLPILKDDICTMFIQKHLLDMTKNISDDLKICLLLNLQKFYRYSTKDDLETYVLPLFKEWGRDKSLRVRMTCVKSIPNLSLYITSEYRNDELIPLMININDSRPIFIDSLVSGVIGKFIYTFKDDGLPDNLLDFYINNFYNDLGSAMEIAYSFPAVVQVLGQNYWYKINNIYQYLCDMSESDIRLTLSSSICEISKLIGKENNSKYLIEPLKRFIDDEDNEISLRVLEQITTTMCNFPINDMKNIILKFISKITHRQWRYRALIAEQLPQIIKIVQENNIYAVDILKIFQLLTTDGIAEVREILIKKMGDISNAITNPTIGQSILDHLKAMGRLNVSFRYREFYVKACYTLYDYIDKDMFKREFLDILVCLKNDRVHNISEYAQKCLDKIEKNHGY